MLDWKSTVRNRVAGLNLRPPRQAEIVEELAQHLADIYDEACASGVNEEEARRLALDELSHGALARELLRAERPAVEAMPHIAGRRGNMLSGIWQDVRYGARMLRKNPLFTLVAVVTLALGIGANTATFSVLHALLIRPLPYRDADRVTLVLGWDTRRNDMRFNMPLSEAVQWFGSPSFEHTGAYLYWSANLVGVQDPERLQAYRVSANMFALLGVEPMLGRTFRPDEGRPGAPGVVVLNHGLWQRRFGGDRNVVGRTIQLDQEPYEIIGVMPAKFEFPVMNYKGDLWAPLRFNPAEFRLDQPAPSIVGIARLRSGVPLSRAQAEMDGIYARVLQQYPTLAGSGARLTPMKELFAEQARPILWTLLGAVGFVLLIACANVANLLVNRALGREREVAIRAAIGASRARLVRQMLTESLLLGLGGGVLGVALAHWATGVLRAAMPDFVVLTMPAVLEIGVNPAVLLFALVAGVVTGLLFGILPALRISHADLSLSLKEGGHTSAGRHRRRLGQALVVAEVALSLVLLASAGVLLRSLAAMLRASPGFDPRNVLVAEVSLPVARYPDEAKQGQFFERVLERAAALPGVDVAGVVNRHPFSTSNSSSVFLIAGRPAPEAADLPSADYREVSPDYFRTLRIPHVAGRTFTPLDSQTGPRTVVVNAEFVRRYFPNEDPIGKQIRFGDARSTDPWRTIIGVVGNIRHWSLRTDVEPETYVPLAQNASSRMTVLLRTTGPPLAVAPAFRAEILAVDANQPIYNVEPMVETVKRSMLGEKFGSALMAIFAGLALVLAAVGTYGVMSYAVTQRGHEIGIRIALGAQRRHILRMIVGHGLLLAGTGVAIGLAGALAATRLLGALLYNVKPADPLTFAGVALLLLLVTLLACYVPARRATRVDPLIALRYE